MIRMDRIALQFGQRFLDRCRNLGLRCLAIGLPPCLKRSTTAPSPVLLEMAPHGTPHWSIDLFAIAPRRWSGILRVSGDLGVAQFEHVHAVVGQLRHEDRPRQPKLRGGSR
jgi:hypothetical protein